MKRIIAAILSIILMCYSVLASANTGNGSFGETVSVDSSMYEYILQAAQYDSEWEKYALHATLLLQDQYKTYPTEAILAAKNIGEAFVTDSSGQDVITKQWEYYLLKVLEGYDSFASEELRDNNWFGTLSSYAGIGQATLDQLLAGMKLVNEIKLDETAIEASKYMLELIYSGQETINTVNKNAKYIEMATNGLPQGAALENISSKISAFGLILDGVNAVVQMYDVFSQDKQAMDTIVMELESYYENVKILDGIKSATSDARLRNACENVKQDLIDFYNNRFVSIVKGYVEAVKNATESAKMSLKGIAINVLLGEIPIGGPLFALLSLTANVMDMNQRFSETYESALMLQTIATMNASISPEVSDAILSNDAYKYYLSELYTVLHIAGSRMAITYLEDFNYTSLSSPVKFEGKTYGVPELSQKKNAILENMINQIELQATYCASHNAADLQKTQDNGFDSEAFAKAFDQGVLTLKRLELPGTEDIRWVSISPKGSYLFGYRENAGCGIYDIEKRQFSLISFDTTGDTHGDLEKIGIRLTAGSVDGLEVVWSPDEKYFTITNSKAIIAMGDSRWDLFLGDVQTKTIRVLQTWQNKFIKDGYATVLTPCFSEADRLCYVLSTRPENGLVYQTYEYNLTTGETTTLFVNSWYPEDGGGVFVSDKYFFRMNDTQFLELVNNPNGSQYGLQLHYRDGDSWENTRLMVNAIPEIVQGEDEYGTKLSYTYRLRKFDDKHFALLAGEKHTRNIRNSILFRIEENNQLVKVADINANNIQPSPDGQYLLSARYDVDPYLNPLEAWGLWASRTADQYNGVMEEVKINLPDSVAQSYEKRYYLEGNGAPAGVMDYGFQWGGNYVLLSPTDVCYFDAAIDAPWNWKTDLAGTSWMCITPMIATLKFLDEGIFTMSAQGEEVTGEYQWVSFNTVALTAYGDTLLFVFEENTLRFESEDGVMTFHYAK